MQCNLCGSDQITKLGTVGQKPVSVTSDSKTCTLPAVIYFCQKCRHVQKVHSPAELALIHNMYENYEGHYLSGGTEQLVFPTGQPPRPRTYHAIERCLSLLPPRGRLLDIGSGNGAVLKSAARLLPDWRLHAFDLSNKYETEIREIPHVDTFSYESLENLPAGKFNLIALWHVLEHVPDAADFLLQLRERLTTNGFLLMQVPDLDRTPFDLAVIDHVSHFTKHRLLDLCQSSGFTLLLDGQEWVHNCITLLFKSEFTTRGFDSAANSNPANYFHWLTRTVNSFECETADRDYAIFGTGMAGIWLSTQLSRKPIFFVDEDCARVGNQIAGIPIIMPEDLPAGVDLVMGFTRGNGENIAHKIQQLYPSCESCRFLISPPFITGQR